MTSKSPNATAAESAIRQIGSEFRRLRGLRGERIEDIATYLDIKSTYLFGIEQGDLSVIPSKRQAKSMVRSYAHYLGLDDAAILDPMEPIISSLKGDKAPVEEKRWEGFDRTSAAILSASVVLGVLVGWSWIGDVNQFDLITPPVTADILDSDLETEAGDFGHERSLDGPAVNNDNVIDTELDEQDLTGEAAEAADALLAELKTVLSDSGEAVTDDAAESALNGSDPSPDKVEDPANVLAALVAERGDGAHIYEAENTDARVIVRALSDVSVQVASRSRDYEWTKSMKPREMLLVPNRDDLELWTANAAGIELLLDGTILPPLGPPDTVISGLSLSASSLEQISGVLSSNGSKPTF